MGRDGRKRGESCNHSMCSSFSHLFFPNLGVFYCKENPILLMFSKLVFNGFSWAIKELIHSFIHISSSYSIWVWVQTHFLLLWIQEEAEIELGADSKCAPEDEGEKLKVKVLVKWSGRIGWLELSKTLYSIFILHSRVFQSVVDLWFFIYSEVFHVKIQC